MKRALNRKITWAAMTVCSQTDTCTGRDLRKTQTYPAKFGKHVAILHTQAQETWHQVIRNDAARTTTFTVEQLGSLDELLMSMPEWPDAGLDDVLAFVRRRLSKKPGREHTPMAIHTA